MLPDNLLKLVTGSVDGELTPPELEQFQTLLKTSPEAQTLHDLFVTDREKLQRTPRLIPPNDLLSKIIDRVSSVDPVWLSRSNEFALAVARAHTSLPAKREQPWRVVAIAASILLAVTAASFWFFIRQDQNSPHGSRGLARGGISPSRQSRDAEREWNELLPPVHAPVQSIPDMTAPRATELAIETAVPSVPHDSIPAPRPIFEGTAFPPLPSIGSVELIQVRVPFLATLAEFEREDVRQKFGEELNRDTACRIDLFSKDPSRAIELLQAAARAIGLNVQIDAMTQERAKRKQGTAYLLYTESLTPLEIQILFTHLAGEDGKGSSRAIGSLHLSPAAGIDSREIKEVLGVDPGLQRRLTGAVTSEPKPISAGTGDQVARNLTTPAQKSNEKAAILTTFTPTVFRAPPATSREIKAFFEKRGERKPTAIPLMLVIRQTNAN